jgi:hypothetical protein
MLSGRSRLKWKVFHNTESAEDTEKKGLAYSWPVTRVARSFS